MAEENKKTGTAAPEDGAKECKEKIENEECGCDPASAEDVDGQQNEDAETVDPTDETPSPEEVESERYMRLMAEFQNYKKRVTKEKSDIYTFANESIVTELLPVLDNFERALSGDTSSCDDSFVKGMNMIFDQFKTVLVNAGLEELETENKQFDPAEHHAVMMDDSDTHESGYIIDVLQKGYKFKGKVIRPAMVKVAN